MILRTSQLRLSHISQLPHKHCSSITAAILHLNLQSPAAKSNQITPVASTNITVYTSFQFNPLVPSRLSIYASETRTCTSNQSAPLLIWKHANSSYANLHLELAPCVTTPQRTTTPSAATLLCRHRGSYHYPSTTL
jgi:hypothetical protein